MGKHLCSGLDARVEESVNVDDILEEAPLGVRARLRIDVVLNSLIELLPLLGLELNSLGLLNGSKGNESNNNLLEHFKKFVFIYNYDGNT